MFSLIIIWRSCMWFVIFNFKFSFVFLQLCRHATVGLISVAFSFAWKNLSAWVFSRIMIMTEIAGRSIIIIMLDNAYTENANVCMCVQLLSWKFLRKKIYMLFCWEGTLVTMKPVRVDESIILFDVIIKLTDIYGHVHFLDRQEKSVHVCKS